MISSLGKKKKKLQTFLCFHFRFRGKLKGHSRKAFLPSELNMNRSRNLSECIAIEGFKQQTATEQTKGVYDYEGNEEG